jgi:hypothetical protein
MYAVSLISHELPHGREDQLQRKRQVKRVVRRNWV